MPEATPTLADAKRLDAADPLAEFRDRFAPIDPELIYLDGNSLGRLPKSTAARLREVIDREWGEGLVRSWHHWVDLPTQVGDQLGAELLGARPGEVAMSDSTTVNLFKLASAALDAWPGRHVVVTADDEFPTDRYVLEGLCARHGLSLRVVPADPDEGVDPIRVRAALDDDVALLVLSHVAYRSGTLAPMAELTEAAHHVGALTLWDLCHAVGAVPIDLTGAGADLAAGCTYKYVNAGPGAPAFLYVRRELQAVLSQPVWGWFGQRDQFAMGPSYEPKEGVGRFLVGSPAVLGMAAVREGVALLAEAGVDRLRAKGIGLTDFAIALADEWLTPLGFTLASPRDPARRGSHVTLRHDDAWRICRALIERANVIPDYREPERIRFGLAPLTTSYVDVWEALGRLRSLVERGEHHDLPETKPAVT